MESRGYKTYSHQKKEVTTSNSMAEKSASKPKYIPKSTEKPHEDEDIIPIEPSNRENGLTIVGIGASAGGLEALSVFLTPCPRI